MTFHQAEPEPPPSPPATCPFCGSSKISTTGEKPDQSAYWRCEGCGDVWNVGRLKTADRFGNRERGRRF
jgi:transposase-like protein